MSFAPENNKDSHLTEKELIQQLAKSYTKKFATEESPESELGNSKQAFAVHFNNILKVWLAFCKFLRSQIDEKQVSVDTVVAGLFLRQVQDESVVITFLPSPEYLEAGKFKLPREVLKEKGAESY